MTPTLLPKGVHLALLRGVSDAAGGPQSPGVHLLRTTLPRETPLQRCDSPAVSSAAGPHGGSCPWLLVT